MTDTTAPKKFCFVLMPFDGSFDDIYQLGIKAACKEAGAYCERVDEQIFSENILERVYNQIAKADIVIADMTGKNANVFYEVGYAHALGKTTILLTQRAEDIPFDLKHYPHIIYESRIVTLKEDLKKRIQFYLQEPAQKPEEKLNIDVFINGQNLSTANTGFAGYHNNPSKSGRFEMNLLFENKSSLTFLQDDFKVGIFFSKSLGSVKVLNSRLPVANLPNGMMQVVLPSFDTMFPSLFVTLNAIVYFNNPNSEESVLIRLYTNLGYREYSFTILFNRG